MSSYNKKPNTSNNNGSKAVAFANFVLVDANGKKHKLRKGVALEMENLLERSIVNAALDNPEVVFTNFEMTVHVIEDAADSADIPLF